jgi:serine protease AprX
VIYGPDLSLESQAPNLTNLDTSGHGTFIAGLIAGRDAGLNPPLRGTASAYRGMAPGRPHPLAQGRHRGWRRGRESR